MKNLERYIIKNDRIDSFFVKANNYLLKKFANEFKESADKEMLLESLWESEFKGSLVKDENYFIKVIFKSTKDLTLFDIRFA